MNGTRLKCFFAALVVMVLTFSLQTAHAALPGDFKELVKTVGPAVVNINTEKNIPRSAQVPRGFEMFRGLPEMERFFEQFDNFPGQEGPRGQENKRYSLGSGFVISADGYIVTNNHVIDGADVVRVSFKGNQKKADFTAKVIGTDPDTDLAVLKIEATGLPFLRFGNSDALEVGEWVIAIGNPLGLDNSVTAGIISAKGRNIHLGPYGDFLQTDASINPGNSGGPLLNMAGEVVGINTAIANRAQGIGFAIPSGMAQRIIEDLKNSRKVSRGWLGVTIQNLDEPTAKALELKATDGALVGSVMEGQPADKAGIKSGDVIIAVNNEAIEDTDTLLRKVAMLAPGEEASITVWREGKSKTLVLKVADRSQAQAVLDESSLDAANAILGIGLRPFHAESSQKQPSKINGVSVTHVKPGSIGADLGLKKGDIIVAVNRRPVESVEEVNKLVATINKEKGILLLQVARNQSLFFRAVELPGS